MPARAPGSLADQDYLDVAAYILSENGYPAGSTALTAAVTAPLAGAAASATTGEAGGPRRPDLSLPAAPSNVAEASTTSPGQNELLHPADRDWLMYNRDYQGWRYSGLHQITTANVASLVPVCALQLGSTGSFETSPVVYHGIGYVTTTRTVQAFNAVTCTRIWSYTYTPTDSEPMPGNRGVALYEGELFRGTTDGHLLALDADSGKLLWDVHVADSSAGYFLSAAPVAVDGRVIIGLAGADWGANGHLYAFDTRTGAESWAKGAEHGGGSSWSSVAVDPERHLVFAPVGNPAPDLDLNQRPGSNLFTNCVVAIDTRTGKLEWYVQQIAGDNHDWDTAAAPVLYAQDGRRYMAVANKGGWLYIYDRDTHALLAKSAVSAHENADVPMGTNPIHTCPGPGGGVEWNGPAYDPVSKALYINSVDWCATYFSQVMGYVRGSVYMDGGFRPDPPAIARGWLRALDAATGWQLWAYHAATPMLAGVTPTAGGVVFTGGTNGKFLAFDARSGRVLYSFNTGGSIGGGISTYAVDGRQYVMVASGNASLTFSSYGGAATIFVFALSKLPH